MDEGRPPEDRIDFEGLERLSPSAPPPKEKRGGMLPKLAAFLVPLVVLAAVPWLILTRVVHTSPKPTPAPTVSVSSSATASPSSSTSAAKGRYEIANLKSCLRIHDSPGTGTPWFDCLTPGVQLDSDGQTAETDGVAWLHVHDPFKKKDGWAAGTYLRKVA